METSADITAVVLAGGRGSRMEGRDKGLAAFAGTTLGRWAVERIRGQVGAVVVNANRNHEVYAAWGLTVCADPPELGAFAGPLAGFVAGLRVCQTPWLLTLPCDTPWFPTDLAQRLLQGVLATPGARIAMAVAPDAEAGGASPLRTQPVFCLLARDLRDDLEGFLHGGGSKIMAWARRHPLVEVRFDRPEDAPEAFFNANTAADLQWAQPAARSSVSAPSADLPERPFS